MANKRNWLILGKSLFMIDNPFSKVQGDNLLVGQLPNLSVRIPVCACMLYELSNMFFLISCTRIPEFWLLLNRNLFCNGNNEIIKL